MRRNRHIHTQQRGWGSQGEAPSVGGACSQDLLPPPPPGCVPPPTHTYLLRDLAPLPPYCLPESTVPRPGPTCSETIWYFWNSYGTTTRSGHSRRASAMNIPFVTP